MDEASFQSPFSGDFLCFTEIDPDGYSGGSGLSISIFRRLSLFHTLMLDILHILHKSFNLHFQETFFVSLSLHHTTSGGESGTFNLHFQETFFVSCFVDSAIIVEPFFFQSPFSGDFLCFQRN